MENSIQKAISLQNSGQTDQARQIFLELLKSEPRNPACLYSIAAIDSANGNTDSALEFMSRAVEALPTFALAHLGLALILFKQGKFTESKASAEKALSIDPQLKDAKSHLELIKTVATNNGIPVSEDGIPPSDPNVVQLLSEAITLQSQNNHTMAVTLLIDALKIAPNDFRILYSLGVSQTALGKLSEALQSFSQLCEVHTGIPLGFHAKGKTFQALGLAEDAIMAYDQAIALNAHYIDAYCDKAALLQAMNRHHDALMTLTKATEFNPNHVRTLEGQGLLLSQFKEYSLATVAFARALEVDPNYDFGLGNLMSARLHNCDWTDYEVNRSRILEGVAAGKLVCNPMTMMAICDDAALTSKCVELYAAKKYKKSDTPLWEGTQYKHRKKRVAFLSGDFRTHPVGYLLIGMIENLDKSRFEIVGFSSCVSDDSDLWRRYRCAFDHYIDTRSMTSLEAAKLMRSMEIDIAIDLSGHTEGTRLDILSHRPAPIQITYLGFPGTLGLDFIDYLIADPRIIPPELEANYKEKILKLPHCYLPRDDSVKPSTTKFKRNDFNLPSKGIVFCSFNHDYKINPELFKVWMNLLKEVPNSVLWLMKLNQGADINLKKNAEAMGISSERIIFATRLPKVEDHLARYKLADIFLDTYPYNGHTTAGDALLAGLPIVTMYGSSFASRVAFSLLSDLNSKEYAFTNFKEYFQFALKLATNKRLRHKCKYIIDESLQSTSWPISRDIFSNNFQSILIDQS